MAARLTKSKKTSGSRLHKGDLTVHQALVNAENIAEILTGIKVPAEFDLLSLDIDRNTHIFRLAGAQSIFVHEL